LIQVCAYRSLATYAANHKLSTLVQMLGLPRSGRVHRTMAHAEMTGHLWSQIQKDVSETYEIRWVSHKLLTRLRKMTRAKTPTILQTSSHAMT